MKNKGIRPIGQITNDQEKLMKEYFEDHQMQFHEVLGLMYAYMKMHYPEAEEFFTVDSSRPVFYYGHKDFNK